LLAAHASATATGFVGESVPIDYAVASSLPVVGFLVTWGGIHVLVWIWAGFTEHPNAWAGPSGRALVYKRLGLKH